MSTEPNNRYGRIVGDSLATIAEVRAQSPESILSFSRGKDSIAAFLAIRDHFDRIVPYSYYLVPGLEFVEASIAYFEQKMGCHIVQYPGVMFNTWLNNMVYQEPDRLSTIDSFRLPILQQDDLRDALVEDHKIDPKAFNAIGMRSKDSVNRAMAIQRNGAINYTRRSYYPVHDYSKQDVIDIIKRAGWKLPFEYRIFSSSFDGLYINYLYGVKLYFPRDYQRILHFFPFAEMEVLRYEAAVKAGDQPPYVPPYPLP